jgi:hypothetical protein
MDLEQNLIDPDDTLTWPNDLAAFVKSIAGKVSQDDGSFHLNENDTLCRLINSNFIVAYHATRLLAHEITEIKANGLNMLTKDLVTRKIEGAVTHGYMDRITGNELLADSTLWSEPSAHRANQICLFAGKSVLDQREGRSIINFLDIWGGESINFTKMGTKHKSLLKGIGIPAIVKVKLVVDPESNIVLQPNLCHVFAGTFLERPVSAGIYWEKGDIPSDWIIDVMVPGQPDFDDFPLPI